MDLGLGLRLGAGLRPWGGVEVGAEVGVGIRRRDWPGSTCRLQGLVFGVQRCVQCWCVGKLAGAPLLCSHLPTQHVTRQSESVPLTSPPPEPSCCGQGEHMRCGDGEHMRCGDGNT